MYEKPQYLTPDGYRRSEKNPIKKTVKKAVTAKNASPGEILSIRKLQKSSERGISKEAAQLIAKAIKGMLHG